MDYNTEREKLILPEYGRIVQNMVNYALTIADRKDRQRCAEKIVEVMGQMFPNAHQAADYKHMLWDHLAMMSGYKLDIDWPYEITKPEDIKKPEPMPYPMTRIRNRHYGHLLEELLTTLKDMEPSAERDKLTEMVANQMRKDLFYWNKNSLNKKKIADDIARLTDGHIMMDEEDVNFSQSIPNGNTAKNKNGRRGGSRGRSGR